MHTFSLLIHDRRYSTPTLQFVFADDETAARTLARRALLASSDHIAVDVHGEGSTTFREERPDGA